MDRRVLVRSVHAHPRSRHRARGVVRHDATVSTRSATSEARRRRRDAALALRESMSPPTPGAGVLRVATWNVNSLRARATSIGRLIDRARPDVILLQETKATHVRTDPPRH